jgi:hypothetical protein
MVATTCAWCGARLERWASQIRERNFCGLGCLGKYRSEHWTGPDAAHWKGGTRRDRGRVLVHCPDHPSAQQNGYVYRYRLVMEEKLCRPLTPDEIVHHIDGDESNDHPDNLAVMTQNEHAAYHSARRPAKGVIPDQCGHGHRLTVWNTRLYYRDGLRKWACRTCQRAASRRYETRKQRERAAA